MPIETRPKTGLHNTSEIGRLKKVMLHRPGRELENLMPEYLERLLFDDIPYLKVAQADRKSPKWSCWAVTAIFSPSWVTLPSFSSGRVWQSRTKR